MRSSNFFSRRGVASDDPPATTAALAPTATAVLLPLAAAALLTGAEPAGVAIADMPATAGSWSLCAASADSVAGADGEVGDGRPASGDISRTGSEPEVAC